MWQRDFRFAFVLAMSALVSACGSADRSALDPRIDEAVALYRADGAEKALPEFERLAQAFKADGSRHNEAAVLHYVGECHWRLGDFVAARTFLDRALELERRSKDDHAEAKTLNVLGLLAWDLGRYDEAMQRFRDAGAMGRTLDDPKLEGASVNNLGLVYDELGRYDDSLEQYRRALALYRGADFPRGEGDTLGNMGGVHLLLGRYREALGYYEQALVISERLESTASMSQDHGNIALSLIGLGRLDEGMKHFDQAIDLAKQAGMRQDQAYWLAGKGNGLVRLGRYESGLDHHRTALALYEEIGSQAELLETLHDMGRLLLLLGDPESAEQHFARALKMARAIGLSRGITQNLLALGDLRLRRQDYKGAAANYEQARERAAEFEEQNRLAESLLRLALVHREQRWLAGAEKEVRQALLIARTTGARPVEAEALYAQAELDRRRARFAAALEGLQLAEGVMGADGDPDLLWQLHFSRALTQEGMGNDGAAIDSLVAAVTLIESVRNRLQEHRFKTGYLQDKSEVYVELVRLQLKQKRTADAFYTTERLRARSYVELLGGRPAAVLSASERHEEARLRERVRHLQRAWVEEVYGDEASNRQSVTAAFSKELHGAERDYQAFLDRHRSRAPVAGTERELSSASQVQAKLQPDEALLEYLVGPDRLTVFVVTAHRLAAYTTPVLRADLNARVALLRDLISRPGDDRWAKPAAALSTLLLDPLAEGDQLRGVKHLYVVPHGVLNYVPFSVLTLRGFAKPHEFLLDKYTLAHLPAAALLLQGENRADLGPMSALAVAPARSRLRYAPEEARSVSSLYQPHARLLTGDDATESRFKSMAGDFRVLHLATHGNFNKLSPLLSGLELEADEANDGLLQVHEILDLRLGADLVTLSACDSALGSGYFADVPAGDEFVAISRAFLSAGSASVLATLWKIDDRASVTLMLRFYEHLLQSGKLGNGAAALSRAQRDILATKDLAHPYYWAPFTLVGKTTNLINEKQHILPTGRADERS